MDCRPQQDWRGFICHLREDNVTRCTSQMVQEAVLSLCERKKRKALLWEHLGYQGSWRNDLKERSAAFIERRLLSRPTEASQRTGRAGPHCPHDTELNQIAIRWGCMATSEPFNPHMDCFARRDMAVGMNPGPRGGHPNLVASAEGSE